VRRQGRRLLPCSAYRVSCRVRAGGSEGLPYGPSRQGSRPIHPKFGGSPVPGARRRSGFGGGRAARRRSPVGVVRPSGTVANGCGPCEG
jgi:hypothetical protein